MAGRYVALALCSYSTTNPLTYSGPTSDSSMLKHSILLRSHSESSDRQRADGKSPIEVAPAARAPRAAIRRPLFPHAPIRCRNGLDKPICLLVVARRFCVLRPEWCQKWCQMASAAPPIRRGLFAPRATRLRTRLRLIGGGLGHPYSGALRRRSPRSGARRATRRPASRVSPRAPRSS